MTEQLSPPPDRQARRAADFWGLDSVGSSIIRRFGVTTRAADPDDATATMTMPIAGMVNPLTAQPTVAPLAILIDTVAGMANHFRRSDQQWTVTTELSMDVELDLVARLTRDSDIPITADARSTGAVSTTSLATCELRHRDSLVGTAIVRSFFIAADVVDLTVAPEGLVRTAETTLAELMSVQPAPAPSDTKLLRQLPDPVLHNAIGVVNGGVTAAALELVASAVVDDGAQPLRTASLRVNCLRGLFSGSRSRYQAGAVHNGRGSALADAVAVSADGTPAVHARFTGYR